MKKLLTIFALLISVVAMGQSKLTEAGMNAIYDTTGLKWLSNPKNSTLIIGSYPSESNIQFVTFQMLLDYEKECLVDTIKADQFRTIYGIFYVVNHKSYPDVYYEKDMADKGYKLAYSRYLGIDTTTGHAKSNYYFVKEATLKGFIQWYKEKGK